MRVTTQRTSKVVLVHSNRLVLAGLRSFRILRWTTPRLPLGWRVVVCGEATRP
jgi:hypothetical protein